MTSGVAVLVKHHPDRADLLPSEPPEAEAATWVCPLFSESSQDVARSLFFLNWLLQSSVRSASSALCRRHCSTPGT
jgi:hypothetical protein